MLPDTELICDLNNGLTLCDANWWHYVFVVQTGLVLSIAVTNLGLGLRHLTGRLHVPLWVAQRFSAGTLLAGVVPLVTGMWLREQVRQASYSCFLAHDETGCGHDLLDRAAEMWGVMTWVGWTEAIEVSTGLIGLAMLFVPRSR